MSKGYTIGRILLTVLFSFFMAAFILSSAADAFIRNSSIYTNIIRDEKLAEKAYSSIESDFKSQYNTTAIPAEVYMDAIDVQWLEDEMCRQTGLYLERINGIEIDSVTTNTALEESITEFFYEYAESINYTPDEAFDEKLKETIINAKSIIDNRIDAFYMKTISKNRMVNTAAAYLTAFRWGLFAIVAVMIFLFAFLERKRNERRVYWSGAVFFSGAALVAIPCIYFLCTGVVNNFAIKDPTTFTAITTLLNNGLWSILVRAIVYGVIGIILIAISVILNKGKSKTDQKITDQ